MTLSLSCAKLKKEGKGILLESTERKRLFWSTCFRSFWDVRIRATISVLKPLYVGDLHEQDLRIHKSFFAS
jgi:hypothetical protein